jgi:hypothetical protein
MEIIAHRGVWTDPRERNTLAAFERAWDAGLGIETDLRDLDGTVVVSHDPPRRPADPPSLVDLLSAWSDRGHGSPLALNIKADGLADEVASTVRDHGAAQDTTVFDMSAPDQVSWSRTGLGILARWSELERPVLTDGVVGRWLDGFTDDLWWDPAEVHEQLDAGSRVVLVSPELHGRPTEPSWARVRQQGLHRRDGFALCTDHPAAAREFFG